MTNLNRRRFIGAAIGTGAVAATAGSWTPAASADSGTGNRSRGVPNSRIGIQLYTMREKMGGDANRANVRRVLNRLDAYGYSEVELAGYAGFTAQQFRALLDNAGLNAVSGHDGVNIDPENTTWQSDYEQTLENANVMGQQYTGLAWFPGPYDDASFWSFLAQRMNEAGELAKAAGLQFFYHNHNFEFENKQADGTPFFDLLLAETDPELVKFELDLYWIIRGGQNPLEYLDGPRGPVLRLPRQGPHVGRPAERGGLRGRRAGRDRLPGHLRRGHRHAEALLRRARRAVAVASRRRQRGVHHRAHRGDVPAERALLGLPGPAGPAATGGPGRSRSSGPSRRSPSRPSGGHGAGRR